MPPRIPSCLKGEVVYESDTRKHKVGDGTTAWNSLPYAGGGDTPDTIPAANVEQDASHRFVTDTEKKRPMECGVTFCSESDMEGQ